MFLVAVVVTAKRTWVTPSANSLDVNALGVVIALLHATQLVPSKYSITIEVNVFEDHCFKSNWTTLILPDVIVTFTYSVLLLAAITGLSSIAFPQFVY